MSEVKDTCTCEQCFEGWLSPRMKERLEYTTEYYYEIYKHLLDSESKDATSYVDYSPDSPIYYLPSELCAKLQTATSKDSGTSSSNAVFRGYISLFKLILDAIQAEGDGYKGFPSVSAISDKAAALRDARKCGKESTPHSKDVSAYLDNGGKVDHVFDCIIDRTRIERAPGGPLYEADAQFFDDMCEGGANPLPACRNDADFALVRRKLGVQAERTDAQLVGKEDYVDPSSDEDE